MAAYETSAPIVAPAAIPSDTGFLTPSVVQTTEVSNVTPVSRYLVDPGLTGNCSG